MSEKIRVICYQDNGLWLAQGLEHDICVQADSLDDVFGRFEVAVRLECDDGGSLDHIAAAPEHFTKLWDRKSGVFTPSCVDLDKYEVGVAA